MRKAASPLSKLAALKTLAVIAALAALMLLGGCSSGSARTSLNLAPEPCAAVIDSINLPHDIPAGSTVRIAFSGRVGGDMPEFNCGFVPVRITVSAGELVNNLADPLPGAVPLTSIETDFYNPEVTWLVPKEPQKAVLTVAGQNSVSMVIDLY